ncbi:MAG: YjcQ family protein [Paraclostridium sp.]
MDNFKIIYKILKHLEKSMDFDYVDTKEISPQKLGISEQRWSKIIKMLYDEDYIEGVFIIKGMGQSYPGIKFDNIQITMTGLEYLEENSFMKKASSLFKDAIDIVK